MYTGQLLIHLGGLMYIIQLTRDAVSAEESAVSVCASHSAATHCNTLQHPATHCNTLQYTARRNLLWVPAPRTTATHCNTLQCTATFCNEESAVSVCTLHYCNALLPHTAIHCNLMQQGICHECLRLALPQHTATRNLLWVSVPHAATHCNGDSAVGACVCVMSHVWMSQVCVMSHVWMSQVCVMSFYEWVKSHIHMRHAADVNLL